VTKAQARARCRQQMKIIAARAKEKKLSFAKKLSEEVGRQKERAREECKRAIAGASAKPRPKRKKATPKKPKKKAARKAAKRKASKKRAPKRKASKKRAPKRKASKKRAKKKKGAPARARSRASPAAALAPTKPAETRRRRGRAQPAETMPYADMVSRIAAAMRSPAARTFGDDKVFIGSVWEQLKRKSPFREMGREAFNRLLLHAHHAGDLRMARADLVSAMDRRDVDDSEIAHMNATFHFLAIDAPKERPTRRVPVEMKIRLAYDDLRERGGLRNVSVHELRRSSGVTRAQLHKFLNAERAAHRANATIGEPTAASPAELSDALMIDGEPHMYVELYPEHVEAPKKRSGSLESRIYAEARRLGGGRVNTRVRISDLHDALPGVSLGQLHEALLRMQDRDVLVLYRIDFPPDIQHRDKVAALQVAGYPRHILYLTGKRPP